MHGVVLAGCFIDFTGETTADRGRGTRHLETAYLRNGIHQQTG